MTTISNFNQRTNFQELANFMKQLNGHKEGTKPFLIRANTSDQIIQNLERDLSNVKEENPVQLVLVKRQLALDFPIAA